MSTENDWLNTTSGRVKCSDVVAVRVCKPKDGRPELVIALEMNDDTFIPVEIFGSFEPCDQTEWEKNICLPALEAAAALRARVGLPPE